MKKVYLTCLCMCLILLGKSQSDFVVGESEGILYIEHQVQANETLQSLCQFYLVRPGAVQKLNNLEASQGPVAGEVIRIPLSESNFFKTKPLEPGLDLHALHFMLGSSDNLKSLSDLLFTSQESIKKLNPGAQFRRGDLVLIGWMHTATPAQKIQTASRPEDVKPLPVASSANKRTIRQKEAPLAKPVLVKNDPNRTVRRVREPKATETKKTFRQIWDELVNGKPKKANASVKPTEKSEPFVGKSDASNKNAQAQVKKQNAGMNEPDSSKKEASGKNVSVKEPERKQDTSGTAKPKRSLKERWDLLVNGKPTSSQKVRRNTSVQTANNRQTTQRKPTQVLKTPVVDSPSSGQAKKSFKERWNWLVNGKPKSQKKEHPRPVAKPASTSQPSTTQVKAPASNENQTPDSPTETASSVKSKKTFRQRWNELVNGKEQTPVKSKQTDSSKHQNPIQTKKQTPVKASYPVTDSNAKVKNKKTLRERWNVLVNGQEKKSSNTMASNQTKPEKKQTPTTLKKPDRKKSLPAGKEEGLSLKETQQNNSSPDTLTSTDPFAEAANEIRSQPSLPDGEARNLEFKQSQNGKAAWFFSGPIGGKFYVVTNLVPKGQLVKVVNTQNGKSVIAEVIGNLPGNDLTKGLILKLSDNAKLPLGQKNPVFPVKIMY